MEPIRKELLRGVYLTHMPAEKFKTEILCIHLITPLDEKTASLGALFPAVLRRGTVRYPDMEKLSCALDLLYGAGIGATVRKKGENQCLGFAASFIRESYVPDGTPLLAPIAQLLGELLCCPVTEDGLFVQEYFESERDNLIDAIRGIVNEKRAYADMRLLQEMCRGERYGVSRFGSEESAKAITNAQLYDYYRHVLETAQVEVFYCGSTGIEQTAQIVTDSLAMLPRSETIVPPVATVHREAPPQPRYLSETMDVTQGKLALGYRVGSEDPAAMLMMNTIFGGFSNSKLFLHVREKLSLCYFASSLYHRAKRLVTVSCGIEFENYQIAMDEIAAQLDALRNGQIEEWEIEGARGCILSALRQREDSAGSMEDHYLGQIVTGIQETTEAFIRSIESVTAEDVAAAAKSLTLDTVYFLKGPEVE